MRWSLTADTISWFRLHDEHPALLPFTEEQGDLYFASAPIDAKVVANGVMAMCATVVGRYLEFDAVVNGEIGSLDELLRQGRGKVASGPMSLMRAFENVLNEGGCRTSLLSKGAPKFFDEKEERWIPAPAGLAVLDLGSSWVVAQSFTCWAE